MAVADRLGLGELYRYSLDDYHRLVEAGGFGEDERVELLDGLLVTMSPKSPRHERAVRWLARWLFDAVDGERYDIGVNSPLTLSTSEPEPDLAVFERGVPSPHHPATAALVVEVAGSSLSRDLGIKAALYAAAGVPEYWVVDLDGGRLLVHRDPSRERYLERVAVGAGGRFASRALELPPLILDDLLRAAGR
jgi:Uma2 family endonuclease